MSQTTENHIILDKELRRDIDAIIQRLKISSEGGNLRNAGPMMPKCPNCQKSNQVEFNLTHPGEGDFFCACNESGARCFSLRGSRERSIVVTKLQEAVMWLGMDLKAINDENIPNEEAIEHEAKVIYEQKFDTDEKGIKYPWTPGGNSLKQDEARREARSKLSPAGNPYPNSKDPSNTVIDKTADGLRL